MRTKISQDLHDEVGATLSSIHVYSSVASRSIYNNPEKSMEAMQQINKNTRQVMENMDDIVWAIKTGQPGESTLEVKLKNYGYELLTPLNIKCMYSIDKDAENKLVSINSRKNILMIAKEAMNNIAKYSLATEAVVKLGFVKNNLHLEISDNGKGFDTGSGRIGNGLNNMKQRSEALGGSLTLYSEEQKGTSVICTIPIANISKK